MAYQIVRAVEPGRLTMLKKSMEMEPYIQEINMKLSHPQSEVGEVSEGVELVSPIT